VNGRLASDHTPYVTIDVLEAGAGREFVVDTGFSGSLYLPEDKIVDWNLRFITSAPMVLANQSVVIADVFEATVVWFSVKHRVPVIAGPSGCDSLVGMEFLEGCRIDLDQVIREVRIDQL
jgi:clan AA aspartic protease